MSGATCQTLQRLDRCPKEDKLWDLRRENRRLREKLQFAMDLIKYAEEQERLDLHWHSCDVPEPGHVCGHCVFLQEVKELLDGKG